VLHRCAKFGVFLWVVAVFWLSPPANAASIIYYTLNVVVTGNGLVTGTGGIDCGAGGMNCARIYPAGTQVSLDAEEAGPNAIFAGWGGACNGLDTCTVVMDADQEVTAQFPPDLDLDGVPEPSDQCPGTPQGEAVDAQGCGPSQVDGDGDGVSDAVDECPNTLPGVPVNAAGCPTPPAGQDADEDGIEDNSDLCPDTPPGAPVNSDGCSQSQLDDDADGVTNDVDQCPDTPGNAAVDANGCASSQLDDDGDGVANDVDQCMDTDQGVTVGPDGCPLPVDADSDGDGVPDSVDQCPDSANGAPVDNRGCAAAQVDGDGDGISDVEDACPGTTAGATVNASGCSEEQLFGNELAALPGLGGNERTLGARLDEICPRLSSGDIELTAAQRELRDACSRLKNIDTTQSQAVSALGEITLDQVSALRDYAVEVATQQYHNLGRRIGQRRTGGGGGMSVSGLELRVGDEQVPGHVIQSAFEGLLGMGASGDTFADFGNLGVYLQGDIVFGSGDETEQAAGYDIDHWNLAIGADYRFRDDMYAGAAVALGDAEIDYSQRGGQTDISSWTLSAYGGWQVTASWYLDALFSYGEADYDTERNIRYMDAGGSFDSTQFSDTDGDHLYLGFNSGYVFSFGGLRVGPTFSATYLDGTINGYTERSREGGSEAWNFIVEDQDFESLRISAGGQADYAINTDFGVIIPTARVAWVYEGEDAADSVILRLANNPIGDDDLQSGQMVIATSEGESGFLDAGLGVSAQFVMGISGFVSYRFYSAYDDYSHDGYTMGLRWDKSF